jgi:hypothetical protein
MQARERPGPKERWANRQENGTGQSALQLLDKLMITDYQKTISEYAPRQP